MDIYLIRHTTPAVARGICYGQTDLDITDTLNDEATIIRHYLPAKIVAVHSSPLQRCIKLAAHLFPLHSIQLQPDLMEIDCGQWEMRNWDDLPADQLDPWMKDFVKTRIPDGESYIDLHERVIRCFHSIRQTVSRPEPHTETTSTQPSDQTGTPGLSDTADGAVILVTHGGPIRSILASITDTPLADSFKAFSLHYGCVVKITEKEGILSHELLSNEPPREKEQHKPARFYKK